MFKAGSRWSLALAGALVLAAGLSQPALAQVDINDQYCDYLGLERSMRQTVIIVDGQMIAPETDGAVAENQAWRAFVQQFVDSRQAFAQRFVDGRERVSIAISTQAGSGLTTLFSGCVPVVRPDEQQALDADTSPISVFFGSDWRSNWEDDAEAFANRALMAMVTGTRGLPEPSSDPAPFSGSTLARALAAPGGFALENGIPRVIVYTDLSRYDLPEGSVGPVRAAGRADAEALQADMRRAEVHIFSAGATAPGARDYLSSLLLASKAQLATLTGTAGSPIDIPAPRQAALYQGTIDLGVNGQYPLRMRLARDNSGTVINSWLEMQANRTNHAPFNGLLNCVQADRCDYIGDSIFARIWADDPNADIPDCQDMPFGGLRDLSFVIEGEAISGTISDSTCYWESREDGVTFTLNLVPNGVF